jgi:hypothetical protein
MPYDDSESMLERILEWAKANPRFNTDTCEGIHEYYERYHRFTNEQEIAIENIYYKWKIDKWYENTLVL